MWQELIKVLEAIQNDYRELLSLSDKKKAALIAMNVSQLETLIKDEQRLTVAIQSKEAKRQEVLRRLADADSRIRPDTKMADLYKCSPSPLMANRLKKLHKALNDTIERVQNAGANNRILIEGALRAVNIGLNRIGGGTTAEPSYGRQGQGALTHNKTLDFRA